MITLQENVDIHPFTTFRVGGKVRYFVKVASEAELTEAVAVAHEQQVPIVILGGGSNVLFADHHWNGMVIKMENISIKNVGDSVSVLEVGAGTTLHDILEYACARGLGGMERLAGIPGTVGGAIRGNAGAFGAEISSVVCTIRAFDRDTFKVCNFSKEDCHFDYHSSFFKSHPEYIILLATLALHEGESSEKLSAVMRDTIDERERKHPQKIPCAGSFFMNPVVTDPVLRKEFELDTGMIAKGDTLPAGWLIDHVGLRGKEVGGAKVSSIHSNYVINTGTATAEDIIILSSVIKQRVRTELGVRLREEVQLIGF